MSALPLIAPRENRETGDGETGDSFLYKESSPPKAGAATSPRSVPICRGSRATLVAGKSWGYDSSRRSHTLPTREPNQVDSAGILSMGTPKPMPLSGDPPGKNDKPRAARKQFRETNQFSRPGLVSRFITTTLRTAENQFRRRLPHPPPQAKNLHSAQNERRPARGRRSSLRASMDPESREASTALSAKRSQERIKQFDINNLQGTGERLLQAPSAARASPHPPLSAEQQNKKTCEWDA